MAPGTQHAQSMNDSCELTMAQASTPVQSHISLCETLDRVLNKGAVVSGEIVISVAGIDLLYLGVQLILTSVETSNELKQTPEPREVAGVLGSSA